MSRRILALTLLVLAGLLGLSLSPAFSQKDEPEVKPPTKEQLANKEAMGKHIEKLTRAYELADYGKENKAPEALITAARLMRELSKVKFSESKVAPKIETEGGQKPVDEAAAPPDLADESDFLYLTAGKLAKSQGLDLDALIMKSKDGAERSPANGPMAVSRMIGPGQVHTYNLRLIPQVPTHFGFRSSGILRLTVVRTDNSNVYSAGFVTTAHTHWTPGGNRIAPIHIRIENKNKQPVQYQFLAN